MLRHCKDILHSIHIVSVLVTIAVCAVPAAGAPESAEPVTAGFRAVRPDTFIPNEAILSARTDYGLEWWYVTGHLQGGGGRLGFELAFFRIGITPPDQTGENTDPFTLRNIYAAHFAVTDRTGETFNAAERSGRGAFGASGADTDGFRVWIGDWSLSGDSNRILLNAVSEFGALELELVPRKPPVRHGARGYSRKSDDPGSASYYVSFTRLEARGSFSKGNRRTAVHGTAWLDREIMSPAETGDLETGSASGWDWFALQLDDGTDVMLYRILDEQGRMSPWSAGTWIGSDGEIRRLTGADFILAPGTSWTSPVTGIRYDTKWTISIPGEDAVFTVLADIPGQEVRAFRTTGNAYWEGSCEVTGTVRARPAGGRAYIEMNRWRVETYSATGRR